MKEKLIEYLRGELEYCFYEEHAIDFDSEAESVLNELERIYQSEKFFGGR